MCHTELKQVGMVLRVAPGVTPREYLKPAEEFQFPVGQLGGIPDALLMGPECHAARHELRAELTRIGTVLSAIWISFPGQQWNAVDGPATVGLVPTASRPGRLMRCAMVSDLAQELGVDTLAIHLGFPPPESTQAGCDLLGDLKMLLEFLASRRQRLLFETGQESAAALNRLLDALEMDNVGVNFDPANFLIYDTDAPLNALEELAPRIVNVHLKDALRPKPPERTGREVRFGEGEIQAPVLLRRLEELRPGIPRIIEREITGEEQRRDIAATLRYLENL